MILVDTNAWVDHLRVADPGLVSLLRENRVVTCDVVLGHLAAFDSGARIYSSDKSVRAVWRSMGLRLS